ASIRKWAHVRTFSAWRENIDPVARGLLEAEGWTAPPGDEAPTGKEIVDRYLGPLAAHPAIRPHVRLGSRVTGISRLGFDKMRTNGRDIAPFVIRFEGPDGTGETVLARAV